ncbi:YheC/YheD family protein [Effusibacillus lacus]|uniref:ATP-grasp domain-containing protein n=1 Tax=Effusibacillus lacus TaxID=1348429 RepID=A0A292YNF6_9BACL|nr:YheC/YheD family protein [Effusibacillus lacus]TCS71083.1 glutathione synthase/RimK-type ligase-like ATP-grasp enzyme [Effusibacillus lacus]GAX90726.1 hypothetical protein EFBL_2367 [Effusibacillus lacus]
MDKNVLFGVMTVSLPNRHSPLSSKEGYVPSTTWRHFHQAGLRHEVKVIFFHPEDVNFFQNRVHAWSCSSSDGKSGWVRKWHRMPDVVYENVLLRALRQTGALTVKREFQKKGIPVFNPALFQKNRIADILKRNKQVSRHIPKTIQVRTVKDVLSFLEQVKCVYLKPVRGTGGKGILELQLQQDSVRVRAQRFIKDKGFDRTFSRQKLAAFLRYLLQKGRYIAQEKVELLTRDGRKIDFRFQLNRNETGKWQLVGIRPKLGPVGSIVSNLHSGGIEGDWEEISEWAFKEGYPFPGKQELTKAAIATAEEFTRYRRNLGLVGLDIGVDVNGRYYVLDVNPRPGRNVLTSGMIRDSVYAITGFAKYLALKYK